MDDLVLEVKSLTSWYRDTDEHGRRHDHTVLHDVSFTIPAGKSFGVLGATGSGKSTLLLLLSRLYAPTKGKITIGGADLASMPAKWVREHVGVVLQEPFLFSRTIEENIGITGASAEEIRQAAVDWLANKGNDEQTAFAQKLELVDDACNRLREENARELLDEAGCQDTEIFWGSDPVAPIEAIMDAAGLRQ